MMTAISTMPVPQELISTICPNCGYSLIGLNPTDKCPECGRPQDTSEVVLYGWARGHFEGIANAKPTRIWLPILGVAGLVIYLFMSSPFGLRRRAVPVIGIGLATVIAVALLRRQGGNHPGAIQIRLYPRGCVQFNSTAPSSWFRELKAAHAWKFMLLLNIAVIVFTLTRRDAEDLVFGIVLLPFVMTGCMFQWRVSRRFHLEKERLDDGAIADSNAAYYFLTGWARVNRFTLNRLKPNRYRLELRRGRPTGFQWSDTSKEIVDAEIELPDEKEDILRRLIKAWITESNR